jgi:E3 ubiquitin-protein ligase ZNF598
LFSFFFETKRCEIEGKKVEFQNFEQLKKHLHGKHNLHYCNLCLKQRKVFLKDQKFYTYKQLQIHQKQGELDSEVGMIKGHPLCKFCNTRFYSDDEIFAHMHLNHYDCHICKQQGFNFEYFNNYDELQKHYESDHYACVHPFCLEQRFIVFSNDLDLKTHEMKSHSKNKKMDLDFFSSPKMVQNTIQKGRKKNQNGVIDSTIIRFVNCSSKESSSEYNSSVGPTYEIPDNLKQLQKEYKEEMEKKIEIQKVKEEEIKKLEAETKRKEDAAMRKKKGEELIQNMKKMLTKSNLFEEFKQTSIQFQKGLLETEVYYQIIVNSFGEENTKKILPDLIDTLPEKNKKVGEELRKIHIQYQQKKIKKIKKKNEKIIIPQNTVKEDWPTFGQDAGKKKNKK